MAGLGAWWGSSASGRAAAALLLLATFAGAAESTHVYVASLGAQNVLLAWGTTEDGGRNTIGRGSIPMGRATVSLSGTHTVTDRNWLEVKGLKPDTEYPYEVKVNGAVIGSGVLRTWPVRPKRLDFFVIGDYGNGSGGQRDIAAAMLREYQRLKKAGTPVRFILTTGDNVYADHLFGIPLPSGTGDSDHHWEKKFFLPYAGLLREIPFFATFGNHDGGESESRGDVPVMFDNFFFPGNSPSPYYRFSFGSLAEFFALDTTANFTNEPAEQVRWLETGLGSSKALWKIAYGHHPPYNAGPRHRSPDPDPMRSFTPVFRKLGVAAYFCGHEHNFQVSSAQTAMAPTVMFLTGAGGELRSGDVRGKMQQSGIAAWAATLHFLHVRIEEDQMVVTPLGVKSVQPVDPNGRSVSLPFVVKRP